MASNAEMSFVSIILFSALISCGLSQTFQYSRGWVNGKRSGAAIPSSKSTDRSTIIADEIPEICKQFIVSDLLARTNPISLHVIAHDYATSPAQMHSATFYQRPQIKHESDLIASAPYGYVETPLSLNAVDLSERYE